MIIKNDFLFFLSRPKNLSLCTAALMYILSRDRLNMDLDRASLDLMIRLLELEQDASSAKLLNEKDMNKIKEKIRRLCETVHNKHLDLENITVGIMPLFGNLDNSEMLNKMELISTSLHFLSHNSQVMTLSNFSVYVVAPQVSSEFKISFIKGF